MYVRLMLVAFLTNGLGTFGLRILAGSGLGAVTELQYLTLWYSFGCLMAVAACASRLSRPKRREIVIGGAMALCSLCGQMGMALSLSSGIPGFVVFPIATGGGLLFVVAVGVLAFREPIRGLGYLGIATGTAALVLLAVS